MGKSRVKKLFKGSWLPLVKGAGRALALTEGLLVVATLAITLNLFSITPTSAATCDPDNKHAPACISMSIETIQGNCPNNDLNNVCVDIPSSGGIVVGGQKLSIISNDKYGEISLSLTTSNSMSALTNSQSGDKIPSMGFDEGLLSQENPIITKTLGDKQWGIALYELIDLSRSNFNNNAYGEIGFDDKTTCLSTSQDDLRGARFVGIELFNRGPISYGYPDVRDYYHPDFTVFYGIRVDNPLSLKSGKYSTNIIYTATREMPSSTIDTVSPDIYELDSDENSLIKVTGTELDSVYQAWIDFGDKKGEMEDSEVCAIDYNTSTWSGFSCTIPASSSITPGTYDLYVTTQGGTVKLESGFTYTSPSICRSGDSKSECQVDIDENMIPVKYTGNETTPEWTSLTKDKIANNQGDWYDYGKKQWANAVTVKDPNKYKNTSKPVEEADILGYWVYIPRYNYQIQTTTVSNADLAKDFEIKFQKSTDQKLPEKANTEPAVGDWVTHPAFSWGDKELNGIWIGKFETTGSTTAPTILPSQYHKASEHIGTYYDIAKSLGIKDNNNPYGNGTKTSQNSHNLNGAKTHMLKNSEWGAITYLASSKYGAGVNKVQLNASADNSDGSNDGDGKDSASITGCGPKADGDTTTYDCSGDVTHQYQSTLGRLASTTNNIYGIYDMAGGAYDYVMGNWTDTEGKGSMGAANASYFVNLPTPPYVDLYKDINSNSQCTWLTCGGGALYETNGWGGSDTKLVSRSAPWLDRGGYWSNKTKAVLFYQGTSSGVNYKYFSGFRVTLLTV